VRVEADEFDLALYAISVKVSAMLKEAGAGAFILVAAAPGLAVAESRMVTNIDHPSALEILREVATNPCDSEITVRGN
jgi:hypothetical protein